MDILLDTSWKLVVTLFGLVATVVAVKVGFSFDINQWQESKRKWRKVKLRAKCPHATVIKEGDQYGFKSTFSIVLGTGWWRCWRCSLETHDISGSKRMIERFADDRKLYFEREKAFSRAQNKSYG